MKIERSTLGLSEYIENVLSVPGVRIGIVGTRLPHSVPERRQGRAAYQRAACASQPGPLQRVQVATRPRFCGALRIPEAAPNQTARAVQIAAFSRKSGKYASVRTEHLRMTRRFFNSLRLGGRNSEQNALGIVQGVHGQGKLQENKQ